MTFISGSMTSANPAADLYAQMAPALVSAGFTLVDTVVIGTRTHKVWKSAAANNSQGLDWYLDVAYTTTGAGSVWLGTFEYYDPVTHLGYRGPYNGIRELTGPEQTYYSRYGAVGYALETNWTHVANHLAKLKTQTTSYAYWISITQDRVIGLTSLSPTWVYYCGFYDPYPPYANKAGASLYPLITATISNPGVSESTSQTPRLGGESAPSTNADAVPAGLTRHSLFPSIRHEASPAYHNWHSSISIRSVQGYISGSDVRTFSSYGGCVGAVDTGPSPYYDTVRGSYLGVFDEVLAGYQTVLGKLIDVCLFGASAVTRGDSAQISGIPWIFSGQSGNRVYGFKAV